MKKRFAAAAGSGSGFRRSLGALALMLTCGVFAAFSALPSPALAGPPPGMQVATGDVVTDADGAPMAAGYMTITQGSFPWTLNYDEVQIVLEGELHLGGDAGGKVGRPGDILYVPYPGDPDKRQIKGFLGRLDELSGMNSIGYLRRSIGLKLTEKL